MYIRFAHERFSTKRPKRRRQWETTARMAELQRRDQKQLFVHDVSTEYKGITSAAFQPSFTHISRRLQRTISHCNVVVVVVCVVFYSLEFPCCTSCYILRAKCVETEPDQTKRVQHTVSDRTTEHNTNHTHTPHIHPNVFVCSLCAILSH